LGGSPPIEYGAVPTSTLESDTRDGADALAAVTTTVS
jgi:hypothetical protein